jgi:hypothetical protein
MSVVVCVHAPPAEMPAEAFAKDARNHVVLPATQRLGDEVEAYEARCESMKR